MEISSPFVDEKVGKGLNSVFGGKQALQQPKPSPGWWNCVCFKEFPWPCVPLSPRAEQKEGMVGAAVVRRCLCALGTGSSAGFARAVLQSCSKDTKADVVHRLLIDVVFIGLHLIPTGK